MQKGNECSALKWVVQGSLMTLYPLASHPRRLLCLKYKQPLVAVFRALIEDSIIRGLTEAIRVPSPPCNEESSSWLSCHGSP